MCIIFLIIFVFVSLIRKPKPFSVLLRFLKISFVDVKSCSGVYIVCICNDMPGLIAQRAFCVLKLSYNLIQCLVPADLIHSWNAGGFKQSLLARGSKFVIAADLFGDLTSQDPRI